MSLHVTQCPKCKSSFNTTTEIREAASGLVRCGACLFVFNAEEHYIDVQSDQDAIDADAQTSVENNNADLSLEASAQRDTEDKEIISRLEPEVSCSEKSKEDHRQATKEPVTQAHTAFSIKDEPPSLFNLPSIEQETELALNPDLEDLFDDQISALRSSQNELDRINRRRSNFVRTVFFSVVIISMSAGVLAALLWFRMPSLSQSPQFRPFYLLACQYVECELAPYSNISLIQSDRLQVASHPNIEDALLFNVVFRNTAKFPQPFPVLSLGFSDGNMRLLAERDFRPDEYLDPQLQGFQLVPSNSPVQITLELVDPGGEAVNYSISFKEPQEAPE